MSFLDQTMLHEKTTSISMDYRLKNGDGDYIDEFIPDTKPLKNDIIYTSGFDHHFVPDYANGVALYDVIIDSNKGLIPKLEDAVIEIESINLFNKEGELQKIDGSWNLALANQHFDKVAPMFNYAVKEPSDAIEVISAITSPTSLNMKLIVDGELFGQEGQTMWVIDEAGVEYDTNGYHLKVDGEKTIVDVNFSISAYHNAENLSLVIENIGEVELHQE